LSHRYLLTESGYDNRSHFCLSWKFLLRTLHCRCREQTFRKPPPILLTPTTSLQPHTSAMTFDMDWSHSFCLACDRQTEGNVYCSEACRLAEYEVASHTGSAASSPTAPRSPVSWPVTKQSNNGFFMEPAYNFGNAQPYGTTPSPRASHFFQASRPQSSPGTFSSSKTFLTPSSSQSSLFSMQSTHSSTASEPIQLSDESRRALRAYASSFDQSRYQRRQSTH
jgi:hypothetical protein